MNERFENSKERGAHAQLARLVGQWKGTTKVWFEPDKVADESSISGTMRLVLGGRFVMHEYKGSFGGNALEGIALYGYHLELKQFQAAWVDSFHNGTAIMYSEAKRGDDSIKVLGGYSYVSEQGETRWGWRTEIDVVSDDKLRITAYNISPEGEEAKATETNYQRIKG
jgi:hypothetical protein